MLNRGTIAEKTNICKSHNKLGSRHRSNHHNQQQQLNKLCSPLSLITGSSKRNNSLIGVNNTDAILFKTRNNQLVSQPPNSFDITPFATSSFLELRSVKSIYHKFTNVPNSAIALNSTHILSNPDNLIKQQPVNPKAIIGCYKRNSSKVNTHKIMMIEMKMNPIYYLTALLLTLCALSTTAQFVIADGSLHSNLQKLKISPDIINVPSDVGIIKVELYGNTVKPGDPVPAKNFKDLNMAKIHWEVSNFDARHTLLLLDLDRKLSGNGTNSIYNQFTSLNIPGNMINGGQTIVAFDTPIVPCQPSSKHRILMLAFHQKQNIDIADVAHMSASSGQTTKRENFKLNEFINRNRLDLVAANVFLAIGETNGVCSSSVTLHSLQSVSPSILIAMVTAIIALGLTSSKRSLVN